MSLSVKGTGILDTHVTWDDLIEELKAFGYSCSFPNKMIKDIGAGNGFLSKIALIEPQWEVKNPDLPKKLVVKICSQLTQVEFDPSSIGNLELEQRFRESHNRETKVYNILWKYKDDKLPLAKIYAYRLFSKENLSKGFIIMDFIEDAVIQHVVQNLDDNSLKQGLDAIVGLIAVTVKATNEEKSVFPNDVFEDLCGTFFNSELIATQVAAVSTLLGEEHKDLVEKFANISAKHISIETFRDMDALPNTIGITPVISHGDLWSTNILWKKETKGNRLTAVIDFQSIHMGVAGTDFVTFVCSSLSGAERRSRFDSLQHEFYSAVCSKFTELPFSLDQFKMTCSRVFPFCAYNIATTLASIYPELKEEGNEYPDEVLVKEKLICLLEDIVESCNKINK